MGLKVFIVDMDPQNTAALWALEADSDNPFPATVMSYAPLKEAFTDKLRTPPAEVRCDNHRHTAGN